MNSPTILWITTFIMTGGGLLISLSMTAMHSGEKRTGRIAGIVLADLIMIRISLFFGASEGAWIKWISFIISCAAFLGVFYVIWVTLIEANAHGRADTRMIYFRHASILSVLWLIYPSILALCLDGLNDMGDAFAVLSIAVLNVVFKVVYGLMGVASDTKAIDLDLSQGATAHSSGRLRAAA